MSINVENMRKWIDALRSGAFEQGAGTLRREWHELSKQHAVYCCLGVACELAYREGIVTRHPHMGATEYAGVTVGGSHSDVLPPAVMEWLGLPLDYAHGNVELRPAQPTGLNESLSATDANDNLLWTFEQIADALETRYLGSEQ